MSGEWSYSVEYLKGLHVYANNGNMPTLQRNMHRASWYSAVREHTALTGLGDKHVRMLHLTNSQPPALLYESQFTGAFHFPTHPSIQWTEVN